MEIKTKFNCGDRVFIEQNNSIFSFIVYQIDIAIVGGMKSIRYSSKVMDDIFHQIEEECLFTSVDLLKKHLIENINKKVVRAIEDTI